MSELLTLLVLLPLVAAALLACIPASAERAHQRLALLAALGQWLLSLQLLQGDFQSGALQFVQKLEWVEALGLHYHLGVDGLSLWMALLSTFLVPCVLWTRSARISPSKGFNIACLGLQSAVLGALFAHDLLLFYIFWELMLVPALFLMGIWGHAAAARRFFLYTFITSLPFLVGIMVVGYHFHQLAGHWSFDLSDLTRLVLPFSVQRWLFIAFFVAFAAKAALLPLHRWLPMAYRQCSPGTVALLSAVLSKLGAYGLLRFATPLCPLGAYYWGPPAASLAIATLLFAAFCAWRQQDLRGVLAYSSMSHVALIMLGAFSLSITGITGSLLQMLAHGISSAALFLMVGMLCQRSSSDSLDEVGGIAATMPRYSILFCIFVLSAIALPGTGAFVGEWLILAGTFTSYKLLPWSRGLAVVATLTVIFGAVYMLRVMRKLVWGAQKQPTERAPSDLNRHELWVLVPFAFLVFWLGLVPGPFLARSEPTVRRWVSHLEQRFDIMLKDDTARLISVEDLAVQDGPEGHHHGHTHDHHEAAP